MSTSLKDFFASCETRPVSRECQKQLGLLLQRSPAAEVEQFLLAYHPTKLHTQLLRLLAARTVGSLQILLEGFTSKSKELSKFCAQSILLFSGKNNELHDPDILLPILQTASYITRNKIVRNLARRMTDADEKSADRLFESIADLWGPAAAMPLLCRTSKPVIIRELENSPSLSSFQILTISRRYPDLAMVLLEKVSHGPLSLRGARYIIRKNLPQSLNFCLKNRHHQPLSKSTMRLVLRKYEDVIMASAPEWATILDPQCVKKVFRPETFELFVFKWVETRLQNSKCIPQYPPSCILHLPPKAISSIMSKVDWEGIDDFWENNEWLLKLMDTADRNRIASGLYEKTKDIDWVAFMSCEISIPKIKEKLSTEANAYMRQCLVGLLLATVKTNKDEKAFKEICEFVAVRYRNDKDVLNAFFDDLPDMTATDEKTWALVYSLGVKLCDPSCSYRCWGIGRLFSAALKRNGRPGLKVHIDRLLDQQRLERLDEDFTNLDSDLREECISLVFTNENLASDEPEKTRLLKDFLPILSKWNESSAHSIKTENVDTFILNNPTSSNVIEFVLSKCNGYSTEFIEQLFEKTGSADLLRYLVRRKPEHLAVSREAVDKMVGIRSCFEYVKLLKTLRKQGYRDILKHFYDKSVDNIRDPDRPTLRNTIILLSLSASDSEEFLREIDGLLGEVDLGQGLVAPFLSHPEPVNCEDQENILKKSQHKDSIYRGIGNSFSFIDDPSSIVHVLSRFCINGDLMLFVKDSVYSVGLSLPSAGAKALLSELVHKPVSVMKHALRIHRLISDIKTQSEFLSELAQTERHPTLRTCLFEYALSTLGDTKNAGIWGAVKEMMSRLTAKDEALVTLLQGKLVPLQFWEEYLKLLLEKTEALEDVTVENVSPILNKICNSISTMPISNQFLESLLKVYFLSERYHRFPQSHNSVSNLFIAYLTQKPKCADLQADVEHKRTMLDERLSSAASKEAIVAYHKELGYHPTTTLLKSFVEHFSSTCLHQKEQGVTENENHVFTYLKTLLRFFERIDDNLLFGPFVVLSLTAITCRQVCDQNSEPSDGTLIGQFIDRVYAMNPGMARYALPIFMEGYFSGRKIDACFLLDILLTPESHSLDMQLVRQMIVTKILPENWKKDRSFESFREKFLALVRNSPCEAVLFA